MQSKRDNRIVLDLAKVQWARFYYRNQHGQTRDTKPNKDHFTCNEVIYKKDANVYAAFHPDYPCESMWERALRLDMVDKWTPEVFFKVTANAGIIFTGEKAISTYALWQSKIYGTAE